MMHTSASRPARHGEGGEVAILAGCLTEPQMVALVEAFGGTRLYIPKKIYAGHRVSKAIGLAASVALANALGSGTLRIPIARHFRARYYRAEGMSCAQIARKLGMTETGVQRLLQRPISHSIER